MTEYFRPEEAVTALRKVVTPDADGDASGPTFGAYFTEYDYARVPRRDLPRAAPRYVGDDSWGRASTPRHNNCCDRPTPDDGASLLLTLDPETLATRIVPSAGLAIQELPWQAVRRRIRTTPYGRSLSESERTAGREQDAGIVHVLPAGTGVVLTIDLCPAARPLDRGLFSSLLASFAAAERPVPIGIAITGVWMREHAQDLAWLRSLERGGDIAVTWINHSFNHRYARGLPLSRNFLLEPGTNPELEILATEKAMIENGLRPSVFFRFPGLVSDRSLVDRVVGHGLIPVGSDAWLAKNQSPSPGSIVLVHGNGNEPLGIERFLELVRLEQKAIRHKDWLLFDLRDALVREESGP